MADKKEAVQKTIAEFKEKLSKQPATPDAKQRVETRTLRKKLKRAQRRLYGLATPTLEDRLKATQKHVDIVGKLLADLTKGGAKKVQANAHVHSLRKKTKSLNKRVKKLNRLIEARKKSTGAAAPTT